MPSQLTLPPVLSASRWDTLASALWDRAPRGRVSTDDGATVPRWTNREAVAVISGLRAIAKGSRDGFPLWYQYAAVAYGWTPEGDALEATAGQADADYPADDTELLGQELRRIAGDLEAVKHPDPRMYLSDVFDRRETLQEVSAALRDDGAEAAFKIPLPACKDPNTGKATRPVKGADGKWSCPGGAITVDDPITAIVKSLVKTLQPLAVPIILIALAVSAKKPRRGRRKRS